MMNNEKNTVENNQELHDDVKSEAEAPAVEEVSINLAEEVERYKDQLLRTAAELDNVQKRAARDREDALKYGVTKFANDIVGFADNINRALGSCPEVIPQEFDGVISGIRLIQSEIKNIFERHGLREINPVGEVFNPNFHQAMFEVPAAEGQVSGNVAQVIQVGYMLHDRLLRPALVGVVKGDVKGKS